MSFGPDWLADSEENGLRLASRRTQRLRARMSPVPSGPELTRVLSQEEQPAAEAGEETEMMLTAAPGLPIQRPSESGAPHLPMIDVSKELHRESSGQVAATGASADFRDVGVSRLRNAHGLCNLQIGLLERQVDWND